MYIIANGKYVTAGGKIVDGSNLGFERILNSGLGVGSTDFIDSNSDGKADGWGSTYGNGIMTIVTGNGWPNHSQRFEINTEYYSGLSYNLWQKEFLYGHKYRLKFDLRSNYAVATMIAAGQWLSGYASTNDLIEHHEEDISCTLPIGGYFHFYFGYATADMIGKYIEINNVTLREILTK